MQFFSQYVFKVLFNNICICDENCLSENVINILEKKSILLGMLGVNGLRDCSRELSWLPNEAGKFVFFVYFPEFSQYCLTGCPLTVNSMNSTMLKNQRPSGYQGLLEFFRSPSKFFCHKIKFVVVFISCS